MGNNASQERFLKKFKMHIPNGILNALCIITIGLPNY